MEIHYQELEHDPNHVGWVKCDPSEIEDVKEIFPVEKYELLVGLKYTYDPLTCDSYTLNNPPPPIWGLDVRKRTNAGHKELPLGEDS